MFDNDRLSIVHVLPGRIRLRIPQLAFDKIFATKLAKLLAAEIWITNIRINIQAASIVIQHSQAVNRDVFADLQAIFEKVIGVNFPQIQEPFIASRSATQESSSFSNLTLPVLATILGLASQKSGFSQLRPVAIITLIAAAFPLTKRAYQSLSIANKINIDCLDLLALIFSSLQGKLVTPALIIALHELGDIIRDLTARSTERKTADLLDTIGRFAWVERNREIVQIASDTVEREEIVVVYPGEQIPVDGTIIKGEATIDQQQLTGESMPIVAQVGTPVYASTLVRSGEIRLRCERVGKQTRAAASLELLEKVPVHDTRMANYAAKIANKLIFPSLAWAGLVGAITQDGTRVASILTLDFVTGIRVSMPTAFLGALNHTTRHGILVRSGRTLELLAEVDTIVFDKTGTLTQGEIVVVGVETVKEEFSAAKVLQLAASAEQRITHPVAEAIVRHAKQQQIELLPRQRWHYTFGLGITAEIEGKTVLVGSDKFLQQEGVNLAGFAATDCPKQINCNWQNRASMTEDTSLIYVAYDGDFQGVIQYADTLRPESSYLIATLQQNLGIAVYLLTGDNQQRAAQVAKALRIPQTQVHAEVFPEQKAKIVRNLHRSGRTVAFIGDGINDSVALAYADVSISFADASDVARETADVVLMNNDLSGVLEALYIARETQEIIEQNTLFVVAPNLLALGFASTIGLNPLLATVIHNGTAIAAGLNSLRPLIKHQIENQSQGQHSERDSKL